jgi:hypothetical protein
MARQDERRRDIVAAMRGYMSSPVNRQGKAPSVSVRGIDQVRGPSVQVPGYLKRGGEPGPLSAQRMGPAQRFEFAPKGYLQGNTGAERRMAQTLGVPSGSPTSGIDQYRAQQARAGTDNAAVAMTDAKPTRFDPGAKRRGQQISLQQAPEKMAQAANLGRPGAGGVSRSGKSTAQGIAQLLSPLLTTAAAQQLQAQASPGAAAPAAGAPNADTTTTAIDPRTASVDGGGPAVTPVEAGLAERGGLGGIDAFGSNPYVPMAGREAPAGGEGLPAGFSRLDGGGYQGPQGSLTVQGPQQGAGGLGGQVRRSSPTGLDAETMQRANENARAGGGGGFLGIVGNYSGPTSTTGMSDEQKAAFEQQRQADIASNVAGIEAQTAAVREQRNALRAARGEPLVGEQRYTGPAVNRDSGLDAYNEFRRSNAAREVPTGLSRGRKADMLIQAQELEEQRAQRLQQGQTDARAAGIDAFEAQSADAYRRGALENDRFNAQQQAQGGIEQARINAVKEGFKQQLAADKDETAATREARESVIDRVTEYLATPPDGAMQGDQLGKLGDGMDFLASAVDAGVSDPARLFGATKVYLDGLLTPEQAREQAMAEVGKPGLFGASEETIEKEAQRLQSLSVQQAREAAQRLLFGE